MRDVTTFFAGEDDWWEWLALNHDTATELWMGIRNKHVHPQGLTWAGAVPVALAWGWIDSKSERLDENARRQRWTPRKAGSTWSKVNVAHAQRLIDEGRMQPSGLAAFHRRREDRTGTYSFEQGELVLTATQEAALRASPPAAAFWDAATPGYRKLCTHWLHSAKQQATRDRRLEQLVQASAAGLLIPSQRYGDLPTWVTRAAQAASDAT